MDAEDVARLATAIARANGHNDPSEWVAKVVEAWENPDQAADTPAVDPEAAPAAGGA